LKTQTSNIEYILTTLSYLKTWLKHGHTQRGAPSFRYIAQHHARENAMTLEWDVLHALAPNNSDHPSNIRKLQPSHASQRDA